MYCKHCGSTVEPEFIYCRNCGARLEPALPKKEQEDSGSGGFWALGFFLPVVGLILYAVLEGERPKRARASLRGAIVGFIAQAALIVVCLILYVLFFIYLFTI